MKTVRYVYWQDNDMWLGHLEESPEYQTQGESLEDLQESLKDIYRDLSSRGILGAKHVGELQIE